MGPALLSGVLGLAKIQKELAGIGGWVSGHERTDAKFGTL